MNTVDGKLYVTDRAEDDTTKIATGLFRIDGPGIRTRITGNSTQPLAADGQLALNRFIDQPRGLAFRADGSMPAERPGIMVPCRPARTLAGCG